MQLIASASTAARGRRRNPLILHPRRRADLRLDRVRAPVLAHRQDGRARSLEKTTPSAPAPSRAACRGRGGPGRGPGRARAVPGAARRGPRRGRPHPRGRPGRGRRSSPRCGSQAQAEAARITERGKSRSRPSASRPSLAARRGRPARRPTWPAGSSASRCRTRPASSGIVDRFLAELEAGGRRADGLQRRWRTAAGSAEALCTAAARRGSRVAAGAARGSTCPARQSARRPGRPLAEDLFAVTGCSSTQRRAAPALTDPPRPARTAPGLVARLFGGKVGAGRAGPRRRAGRRSAGRRRAT